FVHSPEHAAVNGLEPVARIRQRATYDDAHGVIQIRAPHLVFNIYVVAIQRFHSIDLSSTIPFRARLRPDARSSRPRSGITTCPEGLWVSSQLVRETLS